MTESQQYNCFTRDGGNAIPEQAGSEAKISSPTTGRTMLWVRNSFRWKFNQWQVSQTFEETSGHVRPEWINKWPNSMTDILMMIIMIKIL
jgi:hypothetical protein